MIGVVTSWLPVNSVAPCNDPTESKITPMRGRQRPTKKCCRLNSELSSAQELRSPRRVERQDVVESTERSEGVGEDAPDLPLGPYCGKLRGMKCSWLDTILKKSICRPQSAACSLASPSP